MTTWFQNIVCISFIFHNLLAMLSYCHFGGSCSCQRVDDCEKKIRRFVHIARHVQVLTKSDTFLHTGFGGFNLHENIRFNFCRIAICFG